MVQPIRSYVTRPGRITTLQKRALETLWDRYCLPFERRVIDAAILFPGCSQTVVEIGFGMGQATAELARRMPEVGFIGMEVFRAGIGKLLSEIDRLGLENVRIVPHDAVEVLDAMVADRSLDGIHVFFPDPWPKKRHHKRRLLQPPVVRLLAEKLAHGGYLYVVTDWEEYAKEILAACAAEPLLENPFPHFAAPRSLRPQTKFERKALSSNRTIREVYFTKH